MMVICQHYRTVQFNVTSNKLFHENFPSQGISQTTFSIFGVQDHSASIRKETVLRPIGNEYTAFPKSLMFFFLQ